MKNNKGFTLVELLAVIVVLSIIIGIAVPSAISVSNRSKKKMYVTKVDMIMDAAKLYGQDYPSAVSTSEICSSTEIVSVESLVSDGKLKKDDNTIWQKDPVTGNDMRNLTVCIYKKNNRIYAKPYKCTDWEKNGTTLEKYCQ